MNWMKKKKVLLPLFILLFFQTTSVFGNSEKISIKNKSQEQKTADEKPSSSPGLETSKPPFSHQNPKMLLHRKKHFPIKKALSPIKNLPVQSGGRIKPFDSFAKESLQLIYGRKSFKGQEASSIVFTWMLLPSQWEQQSFLQIRHYPLKKDLGLPEKTSHFSPKELKNNEKVALLIQELRHKRDKKEELGPYFEAVQSLENQMNLFYALSFNQALPVAPVKGSSNWESVGQLKGELKKKFQDIIHHFLKTLSLFFSKSSPPHEKSDNLPPRAPHKKERKHQIQKLEESLSNFISEARQQNPDQYAQMKKIKSEVHYNNLKPFMLSWIVYLCGLLSFLFSLFSSPSHSSSDKHNILKNGLYKMGWLFLLIAFFLHTYGIGLRVYITGRPPVSNMYETILWVPWGSVLLAIILEKVFKHVFPLIAATLVAVLCLLLSDLAPSILDGSFQPLQPVLRDNFWLVVHVLTICLSYAAFFLALFQADILLLFYILNEKKYKTQVQQGVHIIYRSLQVGVLLLGAGTILGGVWADLSWGRFWGWDPKETWALITLLGYIALLHGRISGWLKNFGTIISSILAFSLVIMAWYGVNFILGKGLHSYGFGTGGRGFIFTFVSLHALFVLYAVLLRKRRLSQTTKKP